MKRSKKIDLIKSGSHIIENDMKGDLKVLDILDSFSTSDYNFKKYVKNIDEKYFGTLHGKSSSILCLWKHELNDRPCFKISELVEVDEPIEFITRDELKKLDFLLSYDELATKLNQMAFDAYKIK